MTVNISSVISTLTFGFWNLWELCNRTMLLLRNVDMEKVVSSQLQLHVLDRTANIFSRFCSIFMVLKYHERSMDVRKLQLHQCSVSGRSSFGLRPANLTIVSYVVDKVGTWSSLPVSVPNCLSSALFSSPKYLKNVFQEKEKLYLQKLPPEGKMATFFGSPPFLSHPITRTVHFSSSPQAPPPPPPPPSHQPTPPFEPQTSAASSSEQQPEAVPLKAQRQRPIKPPTKVESTDWVATSLTRRFGIGAGLAWAAFLAFGVVSEQIKTRFEVSQQEANTRF